MSYEFKKGDIVYANYKDNIKMRSNIGVILAITEGDSFLSDRIVDITVGFPGFISGRLFSPEDCRLATEEERKIYFIDVLKYGD